MADADDNSPMSAEMIAKALDVARSRISSIEAERVELEKRLVQAREEQRLLQDLLALKRGESVGGDVDEAVRPQRLQAVDGGRTINAGRVAVQAVIDELAATGRPIHISELMRQLRARRVPIPGSGTQANLITHLRRDQRLVRPSRGMYGLAAWGLENMPRSNRRRRRRRVTSREGSKS
jgi:hypothetical protein